MINLEPFHVQGIIEHYGWGNLPTLVLVGRFHLSQALLYHIHGNLRGEVLPPLLITHRGRFPTRLLDIMLQN